ncbi:MAG: hypothetical protein KIT14_08265 [bacterium]|nr:hypothetical protein [bacterium]
MMGRVMGSATAGLVVGMALVLATPAVRAESKGCEKIVAAYEEGGGGISADELAKKLHTDVETVRACLDAAAEKKGEHEQ